MPRGSLSAAIVVLAGAVIVAQQSPAPAPVIHSANWR